MTEIMRTTICCTIIATLLFTSCKKEDDGNPTPDGNGTPPAWVVPGCYVDYVHDQVQNPLYAFAYDALQPDRLIGYTTYWALSNDVKDEYVLEYDTDPYPVQLVRIERHAGGINPISPNPQEFREFHWTTPGNNELFLDSIVLYGWDGSVHLRSGVILFDINADGLVEAENYWDDLTTDITEPDDDWSIVYNYNSAGQMIGMFRFDANDNPTYSESYTLSPYLQPNHLLNVHPDLIKANKYAPASITAWLAGGGQYTYNYLYQVNEHNYIIEQDLITSNDTVVHQWFGYECFF